MTTSLRLKWVLDEVDERAGVRATTLPLLSVSISWGVRRRDNTGGPTRSAAEDLSNYKVCSAGDLVVNRMRAFQGALGIAPEAGLVSPDYAVLRIAPLVEQRWLNYFLISSNTVAEMASRVRGIGGTDAGNVRTPRLNVNDLQSMRVDLPCLEEQRSVADYLDREIAQIDELTTEQERLVELLSERREAAVDEALTPDPTWTTSSLKFMLNGIDQGVSPQAEATLADGPDAWGVLKSGCVNRGVFRETEHKRLPDDFHVDPALTVRLGDLIVSRASGSPSLVGSAAIVKALTYRLILSDKLFRLRPDERVDARFLVWMLNTRSYRQQVTRAISGAEGLANNLPLSALRAFVMHYPPVAEQLRIAEHLDEQTSRIDQLIAEAASLVELARERRSALITAAVTGQIDLRSVA